MIIKFIYFMWKNDGLHGVAGVFLWCSMVILRLFRWPHNFIRERYFNFRIYGVRFYGTIAHLGIVKEIYINEVYRTNKKGLVLDIGANIGLATLYFKNNGNEVLAVEPDDYNYEASIKSMPKNMVIGVAISDRSGYCGLTDSNTGITHMIKQGKDYKKSTIDELVSYYNLRPAIIKLDVEGHEIPALIGGLGTLAKFKPVLLIELHHGTKPENILDTIFLAGYTDYICKGVNVYEFE